MKFFNVEKTEYGSETWLSSEELAVVLRVLSELIPQFKNEHQLVRGNLILDHQSDGAEASLVMRTEWFGGGFYYQYGKQIIPSGELAARAIDEMLISERESHYRKNLAYMMKNPERGVPSGIYQWNHLLVMVLNANKGRFLASAYVQTHTMLNPGDFAEDEANVLLTALAKILGNLFKEDEGMQKALSNEFFESCRRNKVRTKLALQPYLELVDNCFVQTESLSEIMAWRQWRQQQDLACRGKTRF